MCHAQTRRCPDTGSGGESAQTAAGHQSCARRSQTDRSGKDLRGEPACGNKWVAIDKVGGLRALTPKCRGRRLGEGGRLRVAHAQRIRSLIVGKLPDQLKLPFYLWTRAAVASLIAREYGISVSLVTMGRYLRAWGLSPQKPGGAPTRGTMWPSHDG